MNSKRCNWKPVRDQVRYLNSFSPISQETYVWTPRSRIFFNWHIIESNMVDCFGISKKQRQGWYPDESRCKSQICIVSNRQYAVKVPFKKPNCFGSVSSLISFNNHVTTFWYCPYERKPELQNIPFKKDPCNWAAHFDSMLKKANFLFCILWFCKYY